MNKILSIIIPVFNEEKTIEILLKKIANVSLPNSINKSILIVDDASTDKTKNIVEQYIKQNSDIAIKYLHKKKT